MQQNQTYLFAESKKELKNIFHNIPLSVIILISAVLDVFLWFFILLTYQRFKEITVIHYSVLAGIDWLDQKIYLFLFPLADLVIFLLNFVLIFFLYRQNEKLLCFFLAITSLLVSTLLLTSFFLVYTL